MAKAKQRSFILKLLFFLIKISIYSIVFSLLWVIAYKFLPVPITATMLMDENGAKREWVSLSNIDSDMPRAVIAAEDSKFCAHDGFDAEAIKKAIENNRQGKRLRGGSTISQQTAKNAFLWQGGGYFRKGLEAYFTYLIENIWGKRRIMEVYLNIAETGIGTYGIEAGSMRYYKKSAAQLSVDEAARIAAALPLPKKRAVVAPSGFTRRYGRTIAARMGVVKRDGLDGCLY